MSSFALRFKTAAGATLDDVDKEIRKKVIATFRSVVMNTPVKKGRARANWQAGVAPVFGTLDEIDKLGEQTVAKIVGAIKPGVFKVDGGRLWLCNNLDYIRELEYGSSKQAPFGMVRMSIQACLDGSLEEDD